MTTAKHPALELHVDERIDYLVVVASMAAADHELHENELAQLSEACDAFDLGAAGTGEVFAMARQPDRTRIKAAVARLKDGDLRFTLMTDLIFMAYADDKVVSEERQELADLADTLCITGEQLNSLEQYVLAVRKVDSTDGVSTADLKKLGGDVAATLVATGVPIGAVAVSGSVFGLSAAGITSGLAALGLGLGMVPGIGAAVGIGIGTYLGVRWVYRQLVEE